MALIGGRVGTYLLRRFWPMNGRGAPLKESAYPTRGGKLEVLLGLEFWAAIHDKRVIEFGCGLGDDAIEIANHGARNVLGLDIQPDYLAQATVSAAEKGVSNKCHFAADSDEPADVVVSINAFEHFSDPGVVLERMASHLVSGGEAWITFGPLWFHPFGGHDFSPFPLAHVVFSERALIKWRSTYVDDGARRFGEIRGGLNQMTIRRFLRLVNASPFVMNRFEAIPIRATRKLHSRVAREFLTSVVRARLTKRT